MRLITTTCLFGLALALGACSNDNPPPIQADAAAEASSTTAAVSADQATPAGELEAGNQPSPRAAGPKVPPEQMNDYWILASTAAEGWVPNHGHNLNVPVCVSVSYTIGSDGVPYNPTVRKVIPDSDLDITALKLVKHFRYRASASNGIQRPIQTYFTVQFNMEDLPQAKQDKLTDKCDLPGYGD